MSFDITRRHLKADLTKRSVFDESLSSEKPSATTNKKLTPTKQQQSSQQQKKAKSERTKTMQQISKGAAQPSKASKPKEFNPYVNAVDENGRRIRVIKKQLKLAAQAIEDNTSGALFEESGQVAIKNSQKKQTINGKVALSGTALTNLSLLTRTSVRNDIANKKSQSYAQKILSENRKGSQTWKSKNK